MYKIGAVIACLILIAGMKVNGQLQKLTIKQQEDDFAIFKAGLKEGHNGLFYFASESSFWQKCDSILGTFKDATNIEDYYLKLRYLISSLNHGHTRILLPSNGNVNYRMAVLDNTKLYLPFEFLIINKKLLIKEDCSKEQLFPKYSIVKSINNISSKLLVEKMATYIPADGINKTFKYYTLYNYFYLNYLFNLLYPEKQGIKIEVEGNPTPNYIQLLKPKSIDSIFTLKNNKSISQYGKQLDYQSGISKQTGYIRISSFYKGFIENFGQSYERFLDSSFTDIQAKHLRNLIIDLRSNEGGGDGYDFLLLSYLINQPIVPETVSVAGRNFNLTRYTVNLSNEVKAFIENPNEFLRNDNSLLLKDQYTGQVVFPISRYCFEGNIVILTNGGTFSAATNVIKRLYQYRQSSKNRILFIGEENGGDIYANSECSGQGYSIRLPNSSIVIDMPLLCTGVLKRVYPKKRLPDYKVFDKINDLRAGVDNVLDFAIKKCSEK